MEEMKIIEAIDGDTREKQQTSKKDSDIISDGISQIILIKPNNPQGSTQGKKNQIMPLSQTVGNEQKENEQNSSTSYCQKLLTLAHEINMSVGFRVILLIFLLLFLVSSLLQGLIEMRDLVQCGENIQKFCLGGFTILFIIDFINWKAHHKFWLIFDFVCILIGIARISVQNDEALRSLKAIACLRIMFFIKISEKLRKTALIFICSWRRALKLIIPLVLMIFVSAAFFFYLLAGLEYKRCRDPANKYLSSNWTVYQEEVFICGESRPCPIVDGIHFQCLNPRDYGVEPDPQELNNMAQGYGLMTFQNMATSVFSIFKQLFITGSSRIINLYKTGFEEWLTIFLFTIFIYIFSIIYLNIFFGFLFARQSLEDNEQENSESIIQIFSTKQSKLSATSSKENSENHDDNQSHNESKKDNVHSKVQDSQGISKNAKCTERQEPQNVTHKPENIFEAAQQIPAPVGNLQQCQEESKDPNPKMESFKNIRTLFALAYCINLSLEFEGQSKEFEYVRSYIELVFFSFFLIEIIVLLIIEKCCIKKSTGLFLKFQIFIGIFYIVGLIYDAIVSDELEEFIQGDQTFSKVYRSCIFLHFFASFFCAPFPIKKSSKIVKLLPKSIYRIRYFIVIWIIVVLTLSLMGFYLHHGKYSPVYQNWYDKFNYEGIYPSLISTILTIYNQEWDTLLFKEYNKAGSLIIAWQLIVLTLGSIIFGKYLLLFLASQIEKMIGMHADPLIQGDTQSNSYANIKVNAISSTAEQAEAQEEQECRKACEICCRKIKDIMLRVLEGKIFKIAKLCVTLILCFSQLALHPQANFSSGMCLTLRSLLFFCTSFYFLEFTLRVISRDLWDQKKTIFQRVQYLIQAFFLIIDILMFTSVSDSLTYQRIEKLRILRISYIIKYRIQHDWNMKVLVNSIYKIFIESFRPAALIFLIYIFSGVFLVKLHKNDFYYCDNQFKLISIRTKQECFNWGGDWVQQSLNLSNPFHGLKYVFIVSTVGGWTKMMTAAMDLNGQDMAPSLNANLHIQLFFIVLFFFANIIALNSFISITLIRYKAVKEQQTGECFLNEKERTWLKVKLQILRLKPIQKEIQPENFIRKYVYRFYHHKSFLIVRGIFFSIALFRIIVLGFFSIQRLVGIHKILWVYLLLIILFQITINILAFGFRKHILYVSFLALSIPSFFILFFIENGKIVKHTQVVFLLILSASFIQLLNRIPSLNKLFCPIIKILPQTLNFFLLIFIALFSYMILGMQFFSFLKFGQELDQYNQNYTNPLLAFYSVIKLSLTESFIEQFIDCSRQMAPNFICNDILNYEQFLQHGQTGCGSALKANIFFLSFHILYNIFLMSIFLGFIVDSYTDILREERSYITKCLLKKAQILWSQKDPEATRLIPYLDFWLLTKSFVDLFEEENQKSEQTDVVKKKEDFLKKLSLSVYEDQNKGLCFQFSEFIQQLAKLFLEKQMKCILENEKVDHIAEQWVAKEKNQCLRKTSFKSSDVNTLILLKSGLRTWKNKVFKTDRMLDIKKIFDQNAGPKSTL